MFLNHQEFGRRLVIRSFQHEVGQTQRHADHAPEHDSPLAAQSNLPEVQESRRFWHIGSDGFDPLNALVHCSLPSSLMAKNTESLGVAWALGRRNVRSQLTESLASF